MDFATLLDAYRSIDPARWVSTYRMMPMWAGLLSVLLGGALLTLGGGRFFRFVAGPVGAVVGLLWVPVLLERLGLPLPSGPTAAVCALVLGAAGFAYPPSAVFVGLGFPAGLLAGGFAGPRDWLIGFLPAFLGVGCAAMVMSRYVGAVTSSLAGGWLLVLGLLASLHQFGGWVQTAAQRPLGVLAAAALFAIAGSVYQLAVQPSPEEAEQLAFERAKAKRRAAEREALERRWSSYSDERQKKS